MMGKIVKSLNERAEYYGLATDLPANNRKERRQGYISVVNGKSLFINGLRQNVREAKREARKDENKG